MFINILWFIGGFIVGAVLFVFGGLQVLLSLFFSMRFTAKLNRHFRGQFNSKVIYLKSMFTILFWGAIIAGATFAIHKWLFGYAWVGYLVGAGFCFLLSLGKLGMNESNVLDYMSVNSRHMSRAMVETFLAAYSQETENERA